MDWRKCKFSLADYPNAAACMYCNKKFTLSAKQLRKLPKALAKCKCGPLMTIKELTSKTCNCLD